jgi:hypothetical protein
MKILRSKPRGLGQSLAASLPACSSLTAAQTVPQGVLIAGGGLATLVGVIGAVVSDQYKEDFAIAAACGLAASFLGGVWAANTAANCIAASGMSVTASPSASSTAPAPIASPEVGVAGY